MFYVFFDWVRGLSFSVKIPLAKESKFRCFIIILWTLLDSIFPSLQKSIPSFLLGQQYLAPVTLILFTYFFFHSDSIANFWELYHVFHLENVMQRPDIHLMCKEDFQWLQYLVLNWLYILWDLDERRAYSKLTIHCCIFSCWGICNWWNAIWKSNTVVYIS